jgi:NADH/NAD ratio-sensing transcriptional regulator Rex
VSKLTLHCVGFKPLRRSTLVGFADISVSEIKLTIFDVAIHTKNGKAWAQLPAKAQINRDRQLIKNTEGKIQYARILEFHSRSVADAFSAAAIKAVLELAPEALDGEESAA